MTNIQHSQMDGIIDSARVSTDPAPLLLTGPTGVGKSAHPLEYTKKRGIGWHEIRCGSIDTHNITGIYVPDHQAQRTTAYPCSDWPTEVAVTKGTFPVEGLLILEELGNAPAHVIPHLLGLLNERRVGRETIARGWTLIATSNRLEDRSGIRTMLATELNRMSIYQLMCPFDEWLDWAIANGIRPEILSYFAGAPDELNESEMSEADPNNPGAQRRRKIPPNSQFCSPRSATKLSRMIDAWQQVHGAQSYPTLATFESFVGQRIAQPLSVWAAVSPNMPTWREIVADPQKARLPVDSSGNPSFGALYYTSVMIAQSVDKRTTRQMAAYVRRVGNHEFTSSTWRMAELAKPEVANTPEYAAHAAGIGRTP